MFDVLICTLVGFVYAAILVMNYWVYQVLCDAVYQFCTLSDVFYTT